MATDHAAYMRDWRKRQPELVSAIERRAYQKQRAEVITLLGGKCVSCGRTTGKRLEIHHVNGDGKEHRARARCNRGVYRDLLAGRYPVAAVELQCSTCHHDEHPPWNAP